MRRRQIYQMLQEQQEQMSAEEADKIFEPSDKELREMFKLKFGQYPRGRMKRETMLERVNDPSHDRA